MRVGPPGFTMVWYVRSPEMRKTRVVDVLPIGIAVALFVLAMVLLPARGDAEPASQADGGIGIGAFR